MPQYGQLYLAAPTRHPEQVQLAFGNRSRLTNTIRRAPGLDLGEHFISSPEVTICGNQQAAESVMSSTEVVERNPGLESALGFPKVEEGFLVEQLFLDVGVEHFKFSVNLGNSGNDLVDLKLFEQAGELTKPFPGIESASTIAQGFLWFSMTIDRAEKGFLDRRDSLAVPQSATDDESRKVVDDEQNIHRLLVDIGRVKI